MSEPRGRSGGYAWYVAAVLCGVHIVAFLDRYLIGLVSEPLRATMHLSDTQLGLLQGTGFVILYAVAAVPLGWVADITNRRNLIAFGITVWSVATFSAAFCSSFGALFVTRLFVGIGEACLVPAAMSLLVAYFAKTELSRGVSIFGMGAFLGSSVAFLGGGLALGYFIRNGGLTLLGMGPFAPWQSLFLAAGVGGLFMLPLLLTIREPARREAGKIAGRVHGLGEGLRYIAAHRGAYGVQIGAVVIAATMGYAGTAWAVSIFVRAHGLSTPQAGALVGTVALFAGPIGNLAGGWFADRVIARNVVGPTPFVIGISIAGALLPAYLFCLSPSLALAVIGYAIFQFFSVFTLPASYCGTQLLTPERYRGIAASVSLLCYTVFAMGVGPPSVGFLTDHLFRNAQALPYALLLVLTLLACVGVPVAFLGRKRFQRDMLI